MAVGLAQRLRMARDEVRDLDSVATRSAEAVEHLRGITPRGKDLLAQVLMAFESPQAATLEAQGVKDLAALDQVARLDKASSISSGQAAVIGRLSRPSDFEALHTAALRYGDIIGMAARRPRSVLRSHLYVIASAVTQRQEMPAPRPRGLFDDLIAFLRRGRNTEIGLAVIVGAVICLSLFYREESKLLSQRTVG